MKKKSLVVLLAIMLVSSAVPLTAAASSLKSNVVALTDVKSTDSNGVVRAIDNDFAYSPIGKSKSPSKMLTAPPPADSNDATVGILSAATGNIYLIDAYAYLGINSSNKLSVSGNSAASQRVDNISGQVVLQRWNGSSWDSYTTYTSESISNSAFLTITKSNITAPTGYYYQTNYNTYITHNNRFEALNKFSGWLWHTN